MKEITKVVVDAMGGDNAPHEIIKGAVEAVGKSEITKSKEQVAGLRAELAEVFQERKTVLKKSSDAEFVAITKDRSEYSEEIISVILSEGDIAGGVIFLQKNEKKHFGEMEKKFAAGAADLLGRQLS